MDGWNVVIAGGLALAVGLVVGANCMGPKPDVIHPPSYVRVTSKGEYRMSSGYPRLTVAFTGGGYHGSLEVDAIVYPTLRHWSCIEVRYNESRYAWWYVGSSDRCAQ